MADIDEQQIAELRASGLNAGAIAKRLGLRPAEVTRAIQKIAAAKAGPELAIGEKPVAACFVNEDWKTGLLLDPVAEAWPGSAAPGRPGGLVTVFLAREDRYDNLRAGTFLVDVYCLGAKDATPPFSLSRVELSERVQRSYAVYDGLVEIPLLAAQNIVYGAVQYALTLGIPPHADYLKTQALLGPWNEASHIKFGREGKPYFVNGPRDNIDLTIARLNKSVGEGNYDTMLVG